MGVSFLIRSAPCSVGGSRSSSARLVGCYPHSAGVIGLSAESGYRKEPVGGSVVGWMHARGRHDDLGASCTARRTALVVRRRAIRSRDAQSRNPPPRRRREGATSPTGQVSVERRGHGVWVHEVFAFRGSPAAWTESLVPVRDVLTVLPTPADRRKLRGLGSSPLIARLITDDGDYVDVAATLEYALDLVGPFGPAAAANAPASSADL